MGYILTTAAEADLRGIIRHTRKHWGDAQVRRYSTSTWI
jgi:plasmid stabilization system protein ParE